MSLSACQAPDHSQPSSAALHNAKCVASGSGYWVLQTYWKVLYLLFIQTTPDQEACNLLIRCDFIRAKHDWLVEVHGFESAWPLLLSNDSSQTAPRMPKDIALCAEVFDPPFKETPTALLHIGLLLYFHEACLLFQNNYRVTKGRSHRLCQSGLPQQVDRLPSAQACSVCCLLACLLGQRGPHPHTGSGPPGRTPARRRRHISGGVFYDTSTAYIHREAALFPSLALALPCMFCISLSLLSGESTHINWRVTSAIEDFANQELCRLEATPGAHSSDRGSHWQAQK